MSHQRRCNMIFSAKSVSDDFKDKNSITVAGTKLAYVNEYEYLGVILDECLTFQKHINYITNIINSKVYLFNKIRKYITCESALILYKASILSYFNIGDISYNSANKALLTKLQTLQNKSLRCIYHNEKNSNIMELHTKARLLTLEDRRKSNMATMAHSRKLSCFELCRNRDRVLKSNDTRILFKPLAKSRRFERCFIYQAIEIWNNCDES